MAENKYQLIKDPIHGSIELHPLLSAIIKTPAFQRLKYLQQLSGLYYVYPGARHTRYEHSIGVSYLAGEFARLLIAKKRESDGAAAADRKKEETDILCIQVAGLCHDLGHGPFSHLFDSVIKERCIIEPKKAKKRSLSHEELSTLILEKIIFEDKNVEKVFHECFPEEKYKWSDEIKKMMNMIHRSPEDFKEEEHTDDLYLYEIVANKETGIDVDKWDYFIRDCHYMGLQHEFDYRRLMQLSRVCKVNGTYRICYSEKEVTNILGMFRTRCSLHHKAYKHKKGIAANHMILEAIKGVIDVPLYESETKSIASILLDLKNALERYLDDETESTASILKKCLNGYLCLNDGIIHLIKNAKKPPEKPEITKALDDAQKLLKRLDEGLLPPHIPSKQIKEEIKSLLLPDGCLQNVSRKKLLPEEEIPTSAFAEDSKKVEAASMMLKRFLAEEIPPCILLEECLREYLSGKKCLLHVIHKTKDPAAKKTLEYFFHDTRNIPEDVVLKTATFEVMKRKEKEKGANEKRFFFKKVKLSYGSESEQADPLDKVPFYKDSPGAGDAVQNISQCKDESLRLFTPVKYFLEEYWWYTNDNENFENDKGEIAEELSGKVKTLLREKKLIE